MRQTGPDTYDALWKVPGQGDLRFGLYAELPAGCAEVTEPRRSMVNSAYTERWTVTCLTLATLGYLHVPQRPVEAVIALSIVFVASEILHTRAGRLGLTARAPWVVALTFGLMHGLGFAGGLSEAGLPDGHIPTALLFFSLGVEAGHLLFIGAVLSLVALTRRVKIPAPRWAPLVAPYAIGSVAMFSGSPRSE